MSRMPGAGNFWQEWAAYSTILKHPVQQRQAQGSLWLTWTLLLLAIGLPLLALAAHAPTAHAALAGAVPLGMLMLMWAVQFQGSIMAQNNPAAMRLIPGMQRRLKRATLGVWLLSSLLMGALVGLPLGHFGQVVVASGLVILTLMYYSDVFTLLAFGFWLSQLAGLRLPAWVGEFVLGDAGVLLGLALLAWLTHRTLRALFGGPAHVGDPPVSPLRLAGLFRYLQRGSGPDLRATASDPPFLRMLGPIHGVGRGCFFLVIGTGIGIRAYSELVAAVPVHDGLQTMRWMGFMWHLMMQPFLVYLIVEARYQRSTEQALVRLSSGAPAAHAINRELGRHLLRRTVVSCGWLSAAAAGMLLLLGATVPEVARAMVVCTFPLTLAGLVLCDYSRAGTLDSMRAALFAIFPVAAGAGAYYALHGEGEPGTWLQLGLASCGLAALVGWSRWRKMLAAPPAFPAGRLA